MANTRRGFLQSGAALAAGLTGAGSVLAGQNAAQPPAGAPGTGPVQVPKMKFGKVEISRMVLGVNPFYGYAHNVGTYGAMMQEWYTQERVVGVIHQCTRYGINAYNYVDKSRAPQDWARFRSEGGHMHLIIQVTAGEDSVDLVKRLQPLALQRQGSTASRSGVSRPANWASWSASAATAPRLSPASRTRAGMSISTPAASTTACAPSRSGARRCTAS
jgi:hypothetical protein